LPSFFHRSRFRLTGSQSHLERRGREQNIQLLGNTHELSPWDFVIYCYDNLGFTKKGLKATKEQWTVLSIAIAPYAKLKELGFYSSDPNDSISRKGHTLEEIAAACSNNKEDITRQIVGCRDEDYSILSFYILCHIECLIALPLPDANKCRALIKQKDFTSCCAGIPRNLGIDVHPR